MRWSPSATAIARADALSVSPVAPPLIEPNCYLQDLFTSEPRASRASAARLINGVYEQAKLAGSPRVYWQTHDTNHTAMQLYDKVAEHSGFVVYRKVL